MTPEQMLTKARTKLLERGYQLERRRAYYEGRHPAQLGSEDWNKTFRSRLAGIIDNQVALVVDIKAEAVVPQAVKAATDQVLDQANATIASGRLAAEADTIAETLRTAEWSGEQTTVAVDYDSQGEVRYFLLDPRATYVQLTKSGEYQWAVHFWIDENTSKTNATIYTPTETLHLASETTEAIPMAHAFHLASDPKPNPHGEIMLVTFDKRRSIVDRIAPQQDLLNKSMQTQAVAGEAYALPLRVWLGIEHYDQATGEPADVAPLLNPATGSRNITFPTANDAEGDERKVIQLDSPDPSKYQGEQEAFRANIARLASVPAFLLQLNSAPMSGDAMEMAYLPHLAAKAADERVYGPGFARLAQLTIMRHTYKLTGRALPAPQLSVVFSTVSTSTLSSRMEHVRTAVEAGMTLADALVEFLGWTREAADAVAERSLEAAELEAEARAREFNAGL